ncbi:MAG: trans-2-enoyl-CoA reductase family protein [Puniceicoccales bacterium]|jgi:enoyl-[acyl-carrier protein] reductase/trans-2-enoyl-CoA reductase (NAD+)|nr:trans-2-enoyl-CoA reductase family protein [Puniceicoccales bacterium]
MIIQPKVRGFVCTTTHPVGCEVSVKEQIAYLKNRPVISDGPRNVLVIGASTGYGLASKMVASACCNANSIGVFFERPEGEGKFGSPGFYNAQALDKISTALGLISESINGDAFSDEIKTATIDLIRKRVGQVDCVIYSLASSKRVDPVTGEIYKSVLKPIGERFSSKTINTDKAKICEIELEPADDKEIFDTVKVMGGEDWARWINVLLSAKVLADGVKTIAYSYIGPEMTWPIYAKGTIGRAKEHLDETRKQLSIVLAKLGGRAYVSVNKAVVTQASAAIPVVPLYISILMKVMKEKNLWEGCLEQMYRLFSSKLYNVNELQLDDQGRIRLDDLEMRADVQSTVMDIFSKITTETIDELSNFSGYREEFLKLFGFCIDGVNYNS